METNEPLAMFVVTGYAGTKTIDPERPVQKTRTVILVRFPYTSKTAQR